MPVDFFETEVRKAQDRFNQTFGVMAVCNIRMRQSVILAIVQMGLLQRKIAKSRDKDLVREEIKRFVRARDVLKNVFNQAEQEINKLRERRKQQWLTHLNSAESIPAHYGVLHGQSINR